MREHLGTLTAEHHAERRVSAQLARERLERERQRQRDREVIAHDLGPGEEPDSRCVVYRDGVEAWCANWTCRPSGWGEGGGR